MLNIVMDLNNVMSGSAAHFNLVVFRKCRMSVGCMPKAHGGLVADLAAQIHTCQVTHEPVEFEK